MFRRNPFLAPFLLSLVITILFFTAGTDVRWWSAFITLILFAVVVYTAAFGTTTKEHDHAEER